jgi:hypothetical protein
MQMKEKICLTGLLLGASLPVLQCNPSSPSAKMFKVTPSAEKVGLSVFWDSQGVLSVHFQKRGDNVNSESYCEGLLKLRDAFRRKLPGILAFIVTILEPIQPEQPRRYFKNCNRNFLNIRYTSRNWALVTSICLVR